MRRYADRRDENERDIIKYLERIGCLVEQISMRKIPDLLVGIGPFPVLMEVKMPGAKLTTSQETFFKEWDGTHIFIVRSRTEAKRVVKLFMPVRVYKCEKCGIFEKQESFSTEPLTNCPVCDILIKQIYSIPAIIFKGNGWASKDVQSKS